MMNNHTMIGVCAPTVTGANLSDTGLLSIRFDEVSFIMNDDHFDGLIAAMHHARDAARDRRDATILSVVK